MLITKVETVQEDIDKIFSLAEAKKFMRIIENDNDDIILAMIRSAITEANNRTSLNLVTATFVLYLPNFKNEIILPKNPIQAIETIEYLVEGDYVVFEDTNYYIGDKNGVSTIVFDYYPEMAGTNNRAVKITFKSGYTPETFPEDLKSWLQVKVSTSYEYREQFLIGATISKFDRVDAVLDRYRIRNF